ncbi:MAG: endolytic transglycosylase MltG [Bacteroidales bacterium]|nr:endolytic transglycosylase MltG [Bacteroidales bacterium]
MADHYIYNHGRKKRKSPIKRFFRLVLLCLFIAVGVLAYLAYQALYNPNTWVNEEKGKSVFIPGGSDFEDVKTILYEHGIIIHRKNFEWVAKQKKYALSVKPGHYVIKGNMNNNELINLLRAGIQVPVKLVFNNIRTLPELAGRISKQIEADSTSIIQLLNDSLKMLEYGFTKEALPAMFIPNTYEFYWNTDAEQFVKRMNKEYQRFWNDQRKARLEEIGMTQNEVVTLASIVEKESNKNDEKSRIAGVYINRIKRGWRLQADPTAVFAAGDFSIKRVLNIHKEIDSPYNTYMHTGLPPGPICLPDVSSINAVLNFEDHKYMYFCARDDFSGYHDFARTYVEHNINAARYRRALNKMNIYK